VTYHHRKAVDDSYHPIENAKVPIDWTEQLATHRRWLESVVRCRLGDGYDPEDVMQDVALAVLPHPNPPESPEQVAPWLYRLTLRKVINVRRSLGRRRRMHQRVLEQAPSRDTAATGADASSWLLKQELGESIERALAQLAPEDREILTLKYTEDWSYRQLSQHLGITEKTVEYRLLRARKNLASHLRDWEPGKS
jgi:RNA polymerase sigma-70 factor (ECF subfamily)